MARFGIRTERGVSMLEVVGIVAALMSLVIGLTYKTADAFIKSQTLDSNAMLRMADDQLRQYIVANGRLPCPALNGDGNAAVTCDQTQQKGYLPYITLGMVDNNYGFGQVPMLYGAYNDGSIALTSTAQTFFPSYADMDNLPVDVATTRNMFDFCKSLADLKAAGAATPTTSGLAVSNLDGSVAYNAAYALALPGQANRDGQSTGWGGPAVNAQYDGLNGSSANRFELPQAPITPTNDDRTQFRTAQDLHDGFRCEAMNSSVSLLAEAVTIQKETEDFASGNADDVKKGLMMNRIGVRLALWEVGQAVAEIASAAEVLGISSGLLAGVSATCPIPPFVACALIPVYATAVANAGIGQGFAIGAAVTAAVGLGLQITATVLYDNLKSRTTITPAAPTLSLASIPSSRVAELKSAYSTSNAAARTAFSLVPVPAPDKPALDNAQLARAGAVDGFVNAVSDISLKTVLSNNLNGSLVTCIRPAQSDCVGYTARQVPQLDSNGDLVMSGGNPVMTTIYTKDNLSAPYAPGLEPALASYYQAVAQAGSNASSGATIASTSTDPAVVAAQASLAATNAALAAAPVVDPATALSSSNSVVTAYNQLLAATADFDVKNLSYGAAQDSFIVANIAAGSATSGSLYNAKVAAQNAVISAATVRSAALDALRAAMGAGYGTWDHTGNTSLCGGGATTGCGWMRDAPSSANAGNATTRASTASSAVNLYLTAYDAHQDAVAYKKLKDTAETKARMAWSDRNGYKTALCATATPSETWLGGAIAIFNPTSWDGSEDLLASPVSGLSCTGSATAADLSSYSAAARAAERAKYCVGGSAPDLALCTLYSATAATQSTIQGAEAIVNAVIQKGIVK